ncbi:hypothetical protein F5Y12DRAFT_710978 [Xylaria sp. FL1777]|nr:hypothetical protein F5Y12DRAFT_710978 [Xylaria sp. FL1777]
MPSHRSSRQQPQWHQRSDGFWELAGESTLFWQGEDGSMHAVPNIQDTTGRMTDTLHQQLIQYLVGTSFSNSSNQVLEFTRAIVITELHSSSSLADPNAAAGPHIGVQLTNDEMWQDHGRSHLLHFRPNAPEHSFFFTKAKVRKQVAKNQDQRSIMRNDKDHKKDKDKRGRPGGGAGASDSHSGAQRGGSKQYYGHSGYSYNQGGYGQGGYSQGGYEYSYTVQFYLNEGFPQLGLLLLETWYRAFNDITFQGLMDKLSEFSEITAGYPSVAYNGRIAAHQEKWTYNQPLEVITFESAAQTYYNNLNFLNFPEFSQSIYELRQIPEVILAEKPTSPTGDKAAMMADLLFIADFEHECLNSVSARLCQEFKCQKGLSRNE